jgi:hypothetical protein
MTTNESRYASFVNIQLKGITDDQVKTIIQNWMYSTTDADFTLGTNALMVMKQKSRFFFSFLKKLAMNSGIYAMTMAAKPILELAPVFN